MRGFKWLAAAALSLSLAACAGTPSATVPADPAQAVYAAKTAFLGALQVADSYAALPKCPVPQGLCSDPKIVQAAYKTGLQAQTALDTAEAIVRTPSSGSKYLDALNQAEQAVQGFVTITQSMKVR